DVRWKGFPATMVQSLDALFRTFREEADAAETTDQPGDQDAEAAEAGDQDAGEGEKRGRRSMADRLTDAVLTRAETLSCDSAGTAHVSVMVDGHLEHHQVPSGSFQRMVSILAITTLGTGAKPADLDQVALNVAARAVAGGETRDPCYRVG